jgi:hypothetical protein
MPRYLISFDAHAMDHIPDDDMPAVAKASHEVVEEALNAGVWVFGGGLENQKASIVATDGTVTDGPYPGGYRRVLCRRRALTRGRAGVGCQERRGLPLRARSPRIHARPGRGELIGHLDLVVWATVRTICLDRMPAVGFAGVCDQRADQARSLSTVVAVRPAVGDCARNGTASALAA